MTTDTTSVKTITFRADEVRAILRGSKTMTRLVVKPQPDDQWPDAIECRWYSQTRIDQHGEQFPSEKVFGFADEDSGWKCPFGGPGDRLWVRETWQSGEFAQNDPRGTVYRATDPDWETCEGWRWRPSIHMPRWASRITLEVATVRVERLQSITEEDALAEGAEFCGHGVEHDGRHYRCSFAAIWDRLNAKRPGCSWDSNPWIWVLSFRRIKP